MSKGFSPDGVPGNRPTSTFYGIAAVDPVSMALVAIVLAVLADISIAAGWLPAWRVSRVAPGEALRS